MQGEHVKTRTPGKFSWQEITQQPHSWNSFLEEESGLQADMAALVKTRGCCNIVLTGCGSCFNLAGAGAKLYAGLTGCEAQAMPASEIILFPETVHSDNDPLMFLISRSGETTEIVEAARLSKEELSLPTVAITCNGKSTLASTCDEVWIIPVQERSVVMTGAFTTVLVLLQFFGAVAAKRGDVVEELCCLPGQGARLLDYLKPHMKRLVEKDNHGRFVHLGQGPLYYLARESTLKIQEMALLPSWAYHSLEFRHGPRANLAEGSLVTLFVSERGERLEKVLATEIQSAGSSLFAICERADDELKASTDHLVELNSNLSEYARLPLAILATQLVAYEKAISRGLDPDRPPHLEQIVAFETD